VIIKREIDERLIVAWTDPSGAEHERDATPDDLARGGFVHAGEHAAFRRSRDGWRDACKKAEREAATLREQARDLRAQPSPGTLAHLRADLRDMTARAEKAEGLLIQRETELRLAREDGAADLERARLHASGVSTRLHAAVRDLDAAQARAEQAERERNEARAEVERLTAPEGGKVMSSGLAEAVELELMRIVDDAIGGLADFGASLVCRGHASGAAHTVAESAYRLGVAHKRARHAQPETKERRCAACFGGRIYRPDDALNDDDGMVCRACGGTGLERTDADLCAQAMSVGLAECDRLRMMIAKFVRRTNEQSETLGAIALVMATPAEQRDSAGSVGQKHIESTLARLAGLEVALAALEAP
jgi:hypothetical protein